MRNCRTELLKLNIQCALARANKAALVVCWIVLGFTYISSAQNNSGPNEGLWPTVAPLSRYDSINLANLNILVHVPVRKKIGAAALPLSFDIFVNHDLTNSGSTLWTFGAKNAVLGTGRILGTRLLSSHTLVTCSGGTQKILYSDIAYVDSSGAIHEFNASYGGCSPQAYTLVAADGSGYTLVVPTSGPLTLYSRSGNYGTSLPLGSFVNESDSNGNQITSGAGSPYPYKDSLGQIALTIASNGGWAGVGSTVSWADVNDVNEPNGNESISLAGTTFSPKTVFGCTIGDWGGNTSMTFPSTATFPDGSVLAMKYEPTPGNPGYYTGRLGEIDLPTGAQITYTYSGGTNGINCQDGTPHTLRRTSPEGTWTYTHTPPASGNTSTTVVIDPGSNETDYTYSGQFEVQRVVYQGCLSGTPGCVGSAGRTLVKTVLSCYNGSFANCTSANVVLPITRADIYMTPGGGQASLSESFYNTYGMLTQQNEFDYGINTGSAPTGTPIKATVITYASPSAYINDRPSCIQVTNGASPGTCGTVTGNTVSLTNFLNYDSHGNVGTIQSWVSGNNFLSEGFSYNANGTVASVTDVNGAVTNYFYNGTGGCNNLLPTSVSLPVDGLTSSQQWNCSGGVPTMSTDANGQSTTYGYVNQSGTADPFWRQTSVTDPLGNTTWTIYASPTVQESQLVFNGGLSTEDTIKTADSLGRLSFIQKRQAPGSSNFDSTQYTYGWMANVGRFTRITVPYGGAQGQSAPGGTAVTTTQMDTLGRTLSVTDGGGGSTTYQYTNQDTLATVGPAPAGENTKRKQYEYDALGRLKSVCEVTGASGSGSCGQNIGATGYLTKYGYDALGNLLTVNQNIQPGATGGSQTRTYAYDGLSRLTSETNPETGTTSYVYDSSNSNGCVGNFNGDLLQVVRPSGISVCYYYDYLHRLTDVGNNEEVGDGTNPCKRFRYDNSDGILGTRPSGVTVNNGLGRIAEVETDTCPSTGFTQSTMITDEWFSYDADGNATDFWESTPNSGRYYHPTQAYWPSGGTKSVWISSLPAITYNPDGEGRTSTVSASSGQNPVSLTNYNAASQVTKVTFGSGDGDEFFYDSNTGRMKQYKLWANGSNEFGNLGWNANGTLGNLGITDAFNSGDNQSCTYSYDDLSRISSSNCGSPWTQGFSYDAFGNLSKNGSISWQPSYANPTTNRYQNGWSNTSYDADGNLLYDTFHSYTWNAYGRPATIDSITRTYDAFDRLVEQNISGTNSQTVYMPSGTKFGVFKAGTIQQLYVPLPGGTQAEYYSWGLSNYRHADWLGSDRLESSYTGNVAPTDDNAYAPFGEPYDQSGNGEISFTGANKDTVWLQYDFPARQYDPKQGRWISPDPAGVAAADPTNPQSWNRYAYVMNNPLSMVDPSGLITSVCEDSCEVSSLEYMTPSNCWDVGAFCSDLDLFHIPMGNPLPPGTYIMGDQILPGEKSLGWPVGSGNPITDIWQDALGLPTLPCQSQFGPWCDPGMLPNPWIMDAEPQPGTIWNCPDGQGHDHCWQIWQQSSSVVNCTAKGFLFGTVASGTKTAVWKGTEAAYEGASAGQAVKTAATAVKESGPQALVWNWIAGWTSGIRALFSSQPVNCGR
jgi:RHS repeat-associated protein